ncbi:MAG: Spy/CpxP family protein refolding chaperone [Pseudochelatococcus sp.]|jgi:hypothetical protein|uniref:Spy/CpxP family protein refolding chaperone n=1 Tax=Pseudochelatococcus sp. TaxID=2020869 RepID=UPI003D903FA0
MKIAIVATSAALLLGSLTHVMAQPAGESAGKPARPAAERHEGGHHGPRLTPEDRAAFTAARLAALKAGLQLTQAQEPHWSTLETALRGIADERAERFAERRGGPEGRERGERPDALEQLTRQATGLRERADNLTKLAEAAKPLYDSLDDAQKRRFGPLLREALGDGPHPGGHAPRPAR